MEPNVIDVAADFTRYPGGRFRSDGKFSGQRFRDDYLVPKLREANELKIILDGTMGYGSSFLEEAFGGLARLDEFAAQDLATRLILETSDPSLRAEIIEYLTAARH